MSKKHDQITKIVESIERKDSAERADMFVKFVA